MQLLKIWYGCASFSKNHLGRVLFAAMLAISIVLISGMPTSAEAALNCPSTIKLKITNPAPITGRPYTLLAEVDAAAVDTSCNIVFGPSSLTGNVYFYVNGAYIGKAKEDSSQRNFPLSYTFKQAGRYSLVLVYEGGYLSPHKVLPSASSSIVTVYRH